jgi:hypothetical protein
MPEQYSICKDCKHRFRRVFLPLKNEMEEIKPMVIDDENVLIIQTCLISGLDLEAEVTIECNYFEPKIDALIKEELNIYKCIK